MQQGIASQRAQHTHRRLLQAPLQGLSQALLLCGAAERWGTYLACSAVWVALTWGG